MMRQRILNEIRRLAALDGGKVPGARSFEQLTDIRETAWRGVYWARWSDAVSEAGLTPNPTSEARRIPDDVILSELANACRHFRRAPTVAELRLYRRQVPSCPDFKTIERRLGGFSDLTTRIRQWAVDREGYADIAEILGASEPESGTTRSSKTDGSVYLLQSGAFYKVGRSDDLERRVKEIRTALPDKAKLVHTIGTDDPSGIEAYWHRRFADRRANGEWFKLSAADIAAFRRRRFQ